MSSPEEIQRNEIEVLKAIFLNDFKELKAAWNSNLHEFLISVYAPGYERQDSPMSLNLLFRLPKSYPRDEPSISLLDAVGISDIQQSNLKKGIAKKSSECRGHEMVFDIVEFVKDELNSYLDSYKSFYDDYQMREKEKEIADRRKIEIDQQLEQEENQKLAEIIQKELQERNEKLQRVTRRAGKPLNDTRLINLDLPAEVTSEFGESFSIYYLIKGPVVLKGSFFQKYLAFIEEDADFIGTLTEMKITNPFYDSSPGQKRLEKILDGTRKCLCISHPSLMKIHAIQLSTLHDPLKLYIFSEREIGFNSLSSVLEKCGKMNITVAIAIVKQIAKVLNFLHSSHFAHKSLSIENVYINDISHVKVGWYWCWKLIQESHNSNPFDPSVDFTSENSWQTSSVDENQRDIFNLGVILCQLLLGASVTSKYSSFEDIFDENLSVPPTIKEFMAFLLLKSESNKSPVISDICEHPALSSSFDESFLASDESSVRRKREDQLYSNDKGESRYSSDFEELEFLGKGGFGQVTKVRNKLDDRVYAIKKVKINPKEMEYNKKILREVHTLSRLHHEYVVRYYQAWLESTSVSVGTSLGASSQGDLNVTATVTFDYSASEDSSASRHNDWLSADVSTNAAPSNSSANPLFRMRDENSSYSDEESLSSPIDNLPKTQFLYIQMEFCANKTLRDVIDEILDEKEAWRLFRQILEGLVHIHGQGMIHRDLKPSNIFLDMNGNIKIGDFGLAVLDFNPRANRPHMNNTSVNESLSSDIGTPIYTSPEQRQGSHYTQKVDIFSLGIIFFEMCYPFATAMERIMVLRDLRELGTFPSNFKRDREKKLIEWLLLNSPKERPSSLEVIQSDLLPTQLEKSYIEEAIRTVANPNTSYYQKLIKVLMSQEFDRNRDLLYDAPSSEISSKFKEKHRNLNVIRDKLAVVFKRHCAIEVCAPLLLPRTVNSASNSSTFTLLDASGNLLELPYSLTPSFARFVARTPIHNLKRFCFDRIYRQNITGGQPKDFFECDFDIVHTERSTSLFHEAEVLKVTQEVLDSFTSLSISDYSLKLNNLIIAEKILDISGISKDLYSPVFQIFGQIGVVPWSKLQVSLIELKISQKSLDFLAKFAALEDENGKIECELKAIMGSSWPPMLDKVFQDFSTIIRMLRSMGVSRKITICPCLTYGTRAFDGLIFQAVLSSKNNVEIFAAGGRYDALIKSFQPPNEIGKPIMGVGVNFSVSKFLAVQEFDDKTSFRTCDVLVCAFGRDIDEKMSLMSMLWNANIRTLIQEDTSTIEETLNICREKMIPWLVIVKDRTNRQSGVLRIRSVGKRVETEVSKDELVKTLHGLINGALGIDINGIFKQRKDANSYDSRSNLVSIDSSQSLMTNLNVNILSGGKKMKYAQKSFIVEKAQKAVLPVIEHISSSSKIVEILVFDVDRDILRRLCNTDVFDDDAYRKIIEAAGANRGTIEKYKACLESAIESKRTPFFFLYSFRDDSMEIKFLK